MSEPTPFRKEFKDIDIFTYDIEELSFIEPEAYTYAPPPDIPSPQANELLTEYYTLAFKSILSDSLDEFYRLFNNLTSYACNKYQFLRNEIVRRNASDFKKLNSSFGLLGHKLPSGVYQKAINDFYLKSLRDETELYTRYMEEHRDVIVRTLSSFIDRVYTANNLYRDIFERDFRITYETYELIMRNAVNSYNVALLRYRFLLQLQDYYNDVYRELVNIERRKFERIRALITEKELEERQKQALNNYYASYSEYLMELERFGYLAFEEYRILLRKYENELRKFRAEIERVNSLSELIRTRVRTYLSSLETVEAQQAVKDIKLDTVMSKIRSERARLSAKESEIRAEIADLRAKLEQWEAEIERYEGDLRKYGVDVDKIVAEYRKEIYDKILSLREQEMQIVDYWEQEFKTRDTYLDLRNQTIFYNERLGEETYNKVRKALEAMRIGSNSVREYNRTMAISYSSVSASIIRSFT